MVERNTLAGFVVLVVFSCLSGWALANVIPNQKLEEKVAASDLVVIATLKSVHKATPSHGSNDIYGTMLVRQLLKGKASSSIEVLLVDGFPEEDMGTLCLHATYLLFLVMRKDGTYDSAAGPTGAFIVDDPKTGRLDRSCFDE